ncbi:hypothetical protein MesoLjLc_22990 [Mesorhizobium sp. L-8-10]|nr:hypothetical protein MesoLjLc_22990 [Mesorhizobium sp. L-8-10]
MLGSVIAAFISGEASNMARRARRAMIVYVLAGLAGLVGIGFLVAAGYIAAAERFGAVETAAGFGVGFLLVAALIIGISGLSDRRRSRREADRRSFDLASIAAAAAISLLPSMLRGRAGIAAVVWPVLAVLAYAIYRENTTPDKGDEPSE